MALVYGALLLHESVGLNSVAGLILILSGIFLTGRKTAEQAISVDERFSPGEKS
jgi:drug/metabolite transporter (DMT)-like permease